MGTTVNTGGVLVQPSNTGRFYRSTFSAVPELALDVGWWVTPLIRLSLGYQFLYWPGVARPGRALPSGTDQCGFHFGSSVILHVRQHVRIHI